MNPQEHGLQTRRWLAIVYSLLWPPLLIAATRRSYQAEVFGLWSWRVLMMLIASSIFMLIASLALVYCRRSPRAIAWIDGCFIRLRRSRILSIGLAMIPVAIWLSIIAYVVQLGMRLDWRLFVGILDLGLLVFVMLAGLLFLGRERKEQRLLMMKCALAGTSFLLSVAAIGSQTSWPG